MSSKTLQLTDELYAYLQDVSLREPPVLKELRKETATMPMAAMQISPEQGQFMALLVKLLNATRTIEVGVFTGYSTLAVALALPAEGYVLACDTSAEYTSVARRYWRRAGVAGNIDLHLAPARETLRKKTEAGEQGSYDFAFIDADKTGYRQYYEQCLQLLRTGGLIAIDNVLWGGSVIDPEKQDDDTRAIRALNDFIKTDERVDIVMLPVGDGLTLARKRQTLDLAE
ncbi:MAG TPA: SAM-dependent methyltransferase [Porticoccaceae bacterium]|nr:SAM-dependent methyltransferase [Porticoccaceae bacterium]HCO59339.1 SAM-dependent methyltransferase [Porticoccaceae bacterium]